MSDILLFWLDQHAKRTTFSATITIAANGANPALTIRVVDRDGWDHPDGNDYDPQLIGIGPMDAGGTILDPSWQPAELEITIANKGLTGMASGDILGDLLHKYSLIGSEIAVEVSDDRVTAITDVAKYWEGEIAEVSAYRKTDISFRCVQKRGWDEKSPGRLFNPDNFNKLPQGMVGTPIPIVIGDWQTAPPGDIGFNSADNYTTSGFELFEAGAARAGIPLLTIDPGSDTGSTEPKYMVSDKEMHTAVDRVFLYERALNRFAKATSAGTSSNPSTGPQTVELADRQFQVAILGTAIHANNNADNSQELIAESRARDLKFAIIDVANTKDQIRLPLPEVRPLGKFVSATAVIWHENNHSLASMTGSQFGIKGSGALADDLTTISGTLDVADPATEPFVRDTNAIAGIDGWDKIPAADLFLDVSSVTGGLKMHVFVMALLVTYEPEAKVVQPGGATIGTEEVPRSSLPLGQTPGLLGGTKTRAIRAPEVTEFDVSAFGFGKGIKDDGSGTYTGSAGAVIEHPADVIHWLLRNIGSATAAEITTTPSKFGSFVQARTDLASYKIQGLLQKERLVSDQIREIAREVLLWVFRRTTIADARWIAFPWELGKSANYRSTSNVFEFRQDEHWIARDSFKVRTTPLSQVYNQIRVNFDYDRRSKSFQRQVFITDTDSLGFSAGSYVRDQNTTAPNNRESQSSTSVSRFGTRELVWDLTWVSDPATATDIRNRLFDWHHKPRVLIDFVTFSNGILLERGHVIQMGDSWDALQPFPDIDSNGSWASKNFQVFRVGKRTGRPTAVPMTAIDVT